MSRKEGGGKGYPLPPYFLKSYFFKRLKSAFLAVLVISSLLLTNASATPAPYVIKYAFNRDIEKVVDDYIEKKDWDKTKIENPPESWTGLKGDDCIWINEYQLWLWYDNAYTTARHLWDSDVDFDSYTGANPSSLNIGRLATSDNRSVSTSATGDAGVSVTPGSGGGGGGGGSGTLGLPTATGSNIVSIAASQIGTKETPAGSNYVGYVKWFNNFDNSTPVSSYAPWEWCCIFVLWCANQAGYVEFGKSGKLGWTGGCGSESTYLRNTAGCRYLFTSDVFNNTDLQDEIQPGDLAFFSDINKSLVRQNIGHIGIVESTGTDSNGFYITLIEGNAGTQGQVGRYKYYKNTYQKFTNGHIIRPKY